MANSTASTEVSHLKAIITSTIFQSFGTTELLPCSRSGYQLKAGHSRDLTVRPELVEG